MLQFLFQLSDDLLLARDDCLQVANVHDTSQTEDLSTELLTDMCVELTASVSTDNYRTRRDLAHACDGWKAEEEEENILRFLLSHTIMEYL